MAKSVMPLPEENIKSLKKLNPLLVPLNTHLYSAVNFGGAFTRDQSPGHVLPEINRAQIDFQTDQEWQRV
jgi:hypothetical protein